MYRGLDSTKAALEHTVHSGTDVRDQNWVSQMVAQTNPGLFWENGAIANGEKHNIDHVHVVKRGSNVLLNSVIYSVIYLSVELHWLAPSRGRRLGLNSGSLATTLS